MGGGGKDWSDLAQDREKWWWALVNAVMNLQVRKYVGNFLTENLIASQEGLCFKELAWYNESRARVSDVTEHYGSWDFSYVGFGLTRVRNKLSELWRCSVWEQRTRDFMEGHLHFTCRPRDNELWHRCTVCSVWAHAACSSKYVTACTDQQVGPPVTRLQLYLHLVKFNYIPRALILGRLRKIAKSD